MKRILTCFLGALLAAEVLSGCASSPKTAENNLPGDERIQIVSTIFPPYDFAREITAGKANLTMLLPPASESHSYDPTPQDIIKIQNCDVFLYVGGESDRWVKNVLDSMDTSNMTVIPIIDCVEAVEEEIVEGMQEEETQSDGPETPEYDEHVWTSHKNAKLIVQKISDALCETDTGNADLYRENTKTYLAQLDELDRKLEDLVANSEKKTLIFGDRFPFRYFADAYGLEYFAAFPGCSTETEASPATVKFLIDKVREENLPAVFHIELSNEKMAQTISEAAGAKTLLFHSCHNLSKADFEGGKTYLNIMNDNAENLKEALVWH